ncbi:MAG: hypothetical protein ACJ07L_17995 [Opitutales bacterium]
MKYRKSWKRIPLRNLITCLAAIIIALPTGLSAPPTKEDVENRLIVNIDDVRAVFNIDAEWIREDLLDRAFYDADGKEIKLGVFHGYRSGIDVSMRGDIADHFAETAEDAFEQAFKKMNRMLS